MFALHLTDYSIMLNRSAFLWGSKVILPNDFYRPVRSDHLFLNCEPHLGRISELAAQRT
jgi:hypothetical protein